MTDTYQLYGRNRGLLSGPRVSQHPSPNHGSYFTPGRPDLLVIHYTAGFDVQSAVDALSDPAREASAHLVIGRDGQVVQLVPFDCKAWHAGVSAWQGITGVNARSIGIELVNAAWIKQSETTSAVAMKHKLEAQQRWWQPFTAEQLHALTQIGLLLKGAFPLRWAVGHDDVATPKGRKLDPGPAFPMMTLREQLKLGGG